MAEPEPVERRLLAQVCLQRPIPVLAAAVVALILPQVAAVVAVLVVLRGLFKNLHSGLFLIAWGAQVLGGQPELTELQAVAGVLDSSKS